MHQIQSIEGWYLRVPLATPYHLSKVMGTLTHSDAIILRITLDDGTVSTPLQTMMINRAGITDVRDIGTGHTPFLTQPVELAELILDLAGQR